MRKRTTYTFTPEEIVSAICKTYNIVFTDNTTSFTISDSNNDTAIDIADKEYSQFVSFIMEVES